MIIITWISGKDQGKAMLNPLTIKDLQLIKLSAGLKVFNGESDVVAGIHLHHPGTGLEVWHTAARWLAQDYPCGGCHHLVHRTGDCEENRQERFQLQTYRFPLIFHMHTSAVAVTQNATTSPNPQPSKQRSEPLYSIDQEIHERNLDQKHRIADL